MSEEANITKSKAPRVEGWEEPWTEFISKYPQGPINWGEDDCMLLAGANVELLTGEDFWTDHRGKYSSEFGSAKYLKSLGYSDAAAMIDSYLDRIPVAFAQRGDLVCYQGQIGICLGQESLFRGYIELPKEYAAGIISQETGAGTESKSESEVIAASASDLDELYNSLPEEQAEQLSVALLDLQEKGFSTGIILIGDTSAAANAAMPVKDTENIARIPTLKCECAWKVGND